MSTSDDEQPLPAKRPAFRFRLLTFRLESHFCHHESLVIGACIGLLLFLALDPPLGFVGYKLGQAVFGLPMSYAGYRFGKLVTRKISEDDSSEFQKVRILEFWLACLLPAYLLALCLIIFLMGKYPLQQP